MSTDPTMSVREKDTVRVPFTLFDELGAGIPLASMNALTVTVTERQEGGYVNGRNATSILNANGGAFDASGGTGYWLMTPTDNTIVNGGTQYGEEEIHDILFQFTYSVTKRGSVSLVLAVKRIKFIS